MRRLKDNLLVQFSVASFVIMLILALVLAITLSNKIRSDALDALAEEAVGSASGRLLGTITPADLAVPMTGGRYDRFHEFVQSSIVSDRIARVKVWAEDGTVIYSNDPTSVGEKFPTNQNLLKALDGGRAIGINMPKDPENERERHLGTLMEVYTPIVFPGMSEPAGAFEIYQYYEPTAQRINELRLWVFGAIGGGFAILYGSLITIVWGGWKTIKRQKSALVEANADMQVANKELARLASFPELNPDPVIETDLDHEITYFNPAARRQFPNLSTEGSGHPVLASLSPTLATLKNDSPRTVISELSLDNKVFERSLSYVHELKRARIYITEITERKQAEEAVQRFNERLETMHQIDRAILAVRSPAEIAQVTSDRIRELLACERVSVALFNLEANTSFTLAVSVASEISILMGGPHPLEAFGDVEELRQGKVNIIEETAALSQSPGDVTHQLIQAGIHSHINAPLIAEGNLIGALNLGADRPKAFTQEHIEIACEVADQLAIAIQQAQLQESLQDMNAELEEAIQAKDEMIANVSHELRTPLTQIIGYSELVMDGMLGGDLNPDQQHAVDVVLSRAQSLNNLVNMLLNFQLLSPEDFDWDEVSLNNLIDMTQVGWQEEAQKKGVALETQVVSHLPPVRGDLQRLQQVLDQLLDNALKFTPEGGAVNICAERRADEVWLSVSDTGVGIPPDNLEQIFERFHQVDGSSTRKYGGMGLGLSLAKGIIELHGGHIWAESEGIAGEGTTIHIALPTAS